MTTFKRGDAIIYTDGTLELTGRYDAPCKATEGKSWVYVSEKMPDKRGERYDEYLKLVWDHRLQKR